MPEAGIAARTHLRVRCIGRPHPGLPTLRMRARAFRGRPGRAAVAETALGVLAVLAQLLAMLLVARWSAWFFDALEAHDRAEVIRQIGIFFGIVGACMLAQTGSLVAKRRLAITLRTDLTDRLVNGWMAEARHWRVRNLQPGRQPRQRGWAHRRGCAPGLRDGSRVPGLPALCRVPVRSVHRPAVDRLRRGGAALRRGRTPGAGPHNRDRAG